MIWEYANHSIDPGVILAHERKELYEWWNTAHLTEDDVLPAEWYENSDAVSFIESDLCRFCKIAMSLDAWVVKADPGIQDYRSDRSLVRTAGEPERTVAIPNPWWRIGRKPERRPLMPWEPGYLPLLNSRELRNGQIKLCHQCGWWLICYEVVNDIDLRTEIDLRAAWGVLKYLHTSIDLSAPVAELCRYVSQKGQERFTLTPRSFEELVADIFKSCGFQVRLTSFSGDQGIDVVILDGGSNDVVGIQVKRWANKVGAEEIRALVGALKLKGLTNGIFVTTSEYTRGARQTAAAAAGVGIPIQLVNPPQFFDRLEIKERVPYADANDNSAPFHSLLTQPHLFSFPFGRVGWENT